MTTILRMTLAAIAVLALLFHPFVLAEEPAAAATPAPLAAPATAGPIAGPIASPGAAPATQGDVQALAEEIRRLKLEIGLRDVEYQTYGAMGPAASKVYFAPKGLSIGGYGEVTYKNMLKGKGDQSDLYRLVVYLGYRFSDRLVFNSEVEFEHGGEETAVEFAYLDYRLSEALQFRVGNVLVPVGMVNELHEPPFFNGVFRPDLERNLIPATWSENGLGVHGSLGTVRYQAYLLTALDATNAGSPLSKGSWVRNARSGGALSRSNTFAGVLAVAWDGGPVSLGGSLYRGRAGQGEPGVDADVTLAELHGRASWRGLAAKAIYAVGTLSDSDLVAASPGQVIGSRVAGGYGELAYDVLALLAPGGEAQLSPFVRYEAYDLNDKVASSQVRDPSVDVTIWTAGLIWKPLATVALKADWQRKESRGPGSAADQVNLGMGFVF